LSLGNSAVDMLSWERNRRQYLHMSVCNRTDNLCARVRFPSR
jgi:hypothetical protein